MAKETKALKTSKQRRALHHYASRRLV